MKGKLIALTALLLLVALLAGCGGEPSEKKGCGNGICEMSESEQSCPEDCSFHEDDYRPDQRPLKTCTELGGFICPQGFSCPVQAIEAAGFGVCCQTACEKSQENGSENVLPEPIEPMPGIGPVPRPMEEEAIFCSDGTPPDGCSTELPLYCAGGKLVPKCIECGCPEGFVCNISGACVKKAEPVNDWKTAVTVFKVEYKPFNIFEIIYEAVNERDGISRLEVHFEGTYPYGFTAPVEVIPCNPWNCSGKHIYTLPDDYVIFGDEGAKQSMRGGPLGGKMVIQAYPDNSDKAAKEKEMNIKVF